MGQGVLKSWNSPVNRERHKVLLGLALPVLAEKARPCPLQRVRPGHFESRRRCPATAQTLSSNTSVYCSSGSTQLEVPGRCETRLRDRVLKPILLRNTRLG